MNKKIKFNPEKAEVELKNFTGRTMRMTVAEVAEWAQIEPIVVIQLGNMKMRVMKDWVMRPVNNYTKKLMPWGYK